MAKGRSTALEAAYVVLSEAQRPMHVAEITKRILSEGLWDTKGKTPERTIEARIGEEINHRGAESRFARQGRRTFALKNSN